MKRRRNGHRIAHGKMPELRPQLPQPYDIPDSAEEARQLREAKIFLIASMCFLVVMGIVVAVFM